MNNKKLSGLLVGCILTTIAAIPAVNAENLQSCKDQLQSSASLPAESITLTRCYHENACQDALLADVPHCSKKLSQWYWNSLTPPIPVVPPTPPTPPTPPAPPPNNNERSIQNNREPIQIPETQKTTRALPSQEKSNDKIHW